MKKVLSALTAAVLLLLCVPAISAQSTSQSSGSDAVAQRITQDTTRMDAYIEELNNATSSEDLDSLASSGYSLATSLDSSALYYKEQGYTALSAAANNTSDAVSAISAAINNSDENAYNLASDRYNAGLAQYNTAIDSYNETTGSEDYGGMLAVLLAFSALLSSILLVQSLIGNKLLRAEEIRNKHQFDLFKSSLVPLSGVIISYTWYALTPPGGTYSMLWGIVLVGYLAFAGSLFRYLKDVRPKIQKLKKQEIINIRKHSKI